jgi:hypothetical protein
MPADVVNRLQERKLQAMDEFIEKSSLGVSGTDVDRRMAAIADYLVDEGIGLKLGLVRFWDYCWTRALSDMAPDRQKEGVEIRALLERGAASLARAAALARKGAELSGHEVARLAQFEEQARQFPRWVAECMARWEMLDRPRKPLNRERVASSQAAYARGEGEPVSDVIARLEQGGPLVKE